MIIQIRANTYQKNIIEQKAINTSATLVWDNDFIDTNADAYIDFLFDYNFNFFSSVTQKPVIVNELIMCCSHLPHNFSRINAWNTFIEKDKLELVTNNENDVSNILSKIGYDYLLVPDITGLIAARNIAMIINEAYFAIDDNISTQEQIDTAMKLGTNYPYGPFEWAEKIGLLNIKALLLELSKTDARYIPSNFLLNN